jgi:hypothetical protein
VNNYRLSYWKTTVLAAFGAVGFGSGLLLWLITRQIVIFGYTWTSENHPFLYWLVSFCLIAAVLFFFAVALAGGICLYSDAKENLKG